MKKFLLIFTALFLIMQQALSDDFFDNYAGVDNAWDGQKPITNQEFEKAIDTLQANKKKKEAKQKKRKIKKISGGGTSLHSNLDPNGEIQAQDPLTKKDEGQLLNIPVDVVLDNQTVLERGFYNVYAEKEDGEIYLKFYQSQYLMGKVRAYETEEDFDSDTIDFVKYKLYNDNCLKILFGSLDYNAYAYLMFYN